MSSPDSNSPADPAADPAADRPSGPTADPRLPGPVGAGGSHGPDAEQRRHLPPGQFGAHPGLAALAAAVAVVAGWWCAQTAGRDQIVAGAAALGAAYLAILLWRWRRRLIVTAAGLQLRGLLGTIQIPWPHVHSITSVVRTRYGISGTTLEIDLDDEGLFVLGRIELGMDPVAAAAELNSARP